MSDKPHTGWIGVDLDGTLAHYDKWVGPEHIGAPIPLMVGRVQTWLAAGMNVKIFTARVGPNQSRDTIKRAIRAIDFWCMEVFGRHLPITATKDFAMIELWDDRCVVVERNTGCVLGCNPPADVAKDSIAKQND